MYLGFRKTAQIQVEAGQITKRISHGRIIGSQNFFPDRQAPRVFRFGLGVLGLVTVEGAQIVQDGDQKGMKETVFFLGYLESPFFLIGRFLKTAYPHQIQGPMPGGGKYFAVHHGFGGPEVVG